MACRALAMVVFLCLCSRGVSAQVRPGDLKLGVDLDAFYYVHQTMSAGDGHTSWGLGPDAQETARPSFPGLTIGYAAGALVPQVGVAFGISGGGTDPYGQDGGPDYQPRITRQGVVSVQPRLELLPSPERTVVLGPFVGLDARCLWRSGYGLGPVGPNGRTARGEQRDIVFGVGPLLGLSAHVFLVDRLSIDFTVLAQLVRLIEADDFEGYVEPRREIDVGLRIGLSGWL